MSGIDVTAGVVDEQALLWRLSRNGWGKAKRAFDATLKEVAHYKLHDLRRTFTTTLQGLGVPLEVREKLLNHISGTQAGVAGVYNVCGFETEMREAIAKYEAFPVQLLRSGEQPEPSRRLLSRSPAMRLLSKRRCELRSSIPRLT